MAEIEIRPELVPNQHLAVLDKCTIDAVANGSDSPLILSSVGKVPFDFNRGHEVGGLYGLEDRRLAVRDIKVVGNQLTYRVTHTTMALYERFHDLSKQESLRNLELAMPLGGCVIVVTADNQMVIQLRTNKSEYMGVPGASAGAIMSAEFDENGKLLPVEDVYEKHAAEVVRKEVGLKPDQFKLSIISFVTETFPKAHHELVSLARTSLTFAQLKQQCLETTGARSVDFISLPASAEAVQALVTKIDCPLPPTHAGAFISYGYMLVREARGKEVADEWLKQTVKDVDDHYRRLDAQVASDPRHPNRYIPILRPSPQGLQDAATAFLTAGLLVSVQNLSEVSPGKEVLKPSEVCITGSVLFSKFDVPGSSDHLRGELALKNITDLLASGYKVAINVTSDTTDEYVKLLEEIRNKYQASFKLDYETPRKTADGEYKKTELSYSGARRRAAELAESFSVRYIVTCELEKNLRDFFAIIKDNGDGLHFLDRQMERMAAGLPFWQNAFEWQQDTAITLHHISAGFLPEGTRPWDVLNGTRVIFTELMATNIPNLRLRPSDLMGIKYVYENPEDDPGLNIHYDNQWYNYPVDHYSAAVYHPVALCAAFGIGVDPVAYDYKHPPRQTELEESEANEAGFKVKRFAQARAIIDQNFDLVANICQWKAEGKWPDIITDAIKNKTPITLKHYSSLDWKITNGRLVAI